MMRLSQLTLIGFSCLVTACDILEHYTYHDPYLKLKAEDYKNITHPLPSPKPLSILPRIKERKNPPPQLINNKVSLNITKSVLLRDVFNELAKQAGMSIVLSPELTQRKTGVFYRAAQLPFIQVLQDICRLENYRFTLLDKLVRIEEDLPYLQIYNVQFLTQTRRSENRISISTNLFASIENSSNRADNGSDSVLTNKTSSDFWAELEQNLKIILTNLALSSPQGTDTNFTIHRQAGLINIFATQQQHQHIESYLKSLWENTSTQVLIEAKIIEVTLFDEFKSGINWNQIGNHVSFVAPLGGITTPGKLINKLTPQRDIISFALNQHDFSTTLNLINKFGTVRTLSNPRVTVMNNQPAMLKVATNEVFFHLEFERLFQGDGKPDIETLSSDVYTIPIGLVLIVQPAANISTGDIIMTIRPTVSRVDKEIEDPAVAIRSKQKVKSTVPVVQVRELDSVLRMKSGQVVVMGGLMEDRSINSSSSAPGIDNIPVLSQLARGKDDERKTTELIIFLTAHVINEPYFEEADKKIYSTFTQDPRPIQF